MTIYFARDEAGRVKIGTTKDLNARLSGLQTGTADKLTLIRTIDGGEATERWLHNRFRASRIRGEWFGFHPDMLSIVPPDEIIAPEKKVVRRDVRLTVRERLNAAQRAGHELGLTNRQILLSFVATLNDDEAGQILQTIPGAAQKEAA